jgi:hypothetical protein
MLKNRAYAAVLALVMAFGSLSLFAARPAHADKENTYKIATYALGAGSIYALTKKKTTLGVLGAAGTYFAYKKWQDAKKDRRSGRRFRRR